MVNKLLEKEQCSNKVGDIVWEKERERTKNRILAVLLLTTITTNSEAFFWIKDSKLPEMGTKVNDQVAMYKTSVEMMQKYWMKVQWDNVLVWGQSLSMNDIQNINKQTTQKYSYAKSIPVYWIRSKWSTNEEKNYVKQTNNQRFEGKENNYIEEKTYENNKAVNKQNIWQDNHTVSTNFSYSTRDKKTTPWVSYSVNLSNWEQQVDFWVEKSSDDLSFKVWAGTNIWNDKKIYWKYEKWKNYNKYSVAWSVLLEDSILDVWAYHLKEKRTTNYEEVWKTKTWTIKENALWAKMTRPWEMDSKIIETWIWWEISKSDNIDHWTVWYKVINTPDKFDQTRYDWWVRWWTLIIWEWWVKIWITEDLTWEFSAWIESKIFSEMYNNQVKRETWLVASASLNYRLDDNNYINAWALWSKNKQEYSVWLDRNLWNWFTFNIWWKVVNEKNKKADPQIHVGITKTLID